MTMSAEYRPKFEDFTGNGDVSILTEKFSSRTKKLNGILKNHFTESFTVNVNLPIKFTLKMI